MQLFDWIVLIGTLLFIVVYGAWKTKGSKNVEEYILGGNETPWYTVGYRLWRRKPVTLSVDTWTGLS
jgi:Na+/proline symporter